MAMAMAMAMAMVIMSSQGKPPSKLLHPDEAHTMIRDVTDITASTSNNTQFIIELVTTRLDGRMEDNPKVETSITQCHWMFCRYGLLSAHSMFTSLDLGPILMVSALVITTSRDK
jgi:hypothetical protein